MNKAQPIEQVGWEALNVYEFRIYPDVLIVTTTASQSQFEEALESYEPLIHGNIDGYLQSLGYPTVAVAKHGKIPIINA